MAELIGIQHSNPTPAFVFRGNLKPLGHYLKGRLVKITEVIPRILQEILQGLEYIHRKKMVHMELNLNTLTVIICYISIPIILTNMLLNKCFIWNIKRDIYLIQRYVYRKMSCLQTDLLGQMTYCRIRSPRSKIKIWQHSNPPFCSNDLQRF